MARKFQARGCATMIFVFLLFCRALTGASSCYVVVSLDMPRYASRGSSVKLHCRHNVPPELIHRVSWQRSGDKLLQYVSGRVPPFRAYNTSGATINISNVSDQIMYLNNVTFTASGTYSCEVSCGNPIFYKSSADKDLTIIQPQNHAPRISFASQLYTADQMLEANCTTAAALPAPHVTWFINGDKVDETLTSSSKHIHKVKKGGEPLQSSTSQLRVAVAALPVITSGSLELTCLSTIPAYREPSGQYANVKKSVVSVEVKLEEETTPTTTTESTTDSQPRSCASSGIILFLSVLFLFSLLK